MPTPPVPPRAAPPPFSRQRSRSRLILGGLVLAVAAVVLGGTLITVPTHVRAEATVAGAGRCAAAGVPVGPSGCVIVRVGAPWADRLAAGGPARLTTADGSVPITLTPVAGVDGPALAAPLETAPGGGTATAVIDVGRRALGLLFVGQGLEARP